MTLREGIFRSGVNVRGFTMLRENLKASRETRNVDILSSVKLQSSRESFNLLHEYRT